MGRHTMESLLALAAICGALLVTTPAAVAADTHVFDAELSLTGSCSTATVDPVPDPGCPEGVHPSKPFSSPRAVATDSYGNIYVASYGQDVAEGAEGRIDVFSAEGSFITEIADPYGPKSMTIDSHGNLYVFEFRPAPASIHRIVRYEPTVYDGATGDIAYDNAPVLAVELEAGNFQTGIAVNPENDHLFANLASSIAEYGTAAENNLLIDDTIAQGEISNFHGIGLAIDAAHNRIYASTSHAVKVFELEAPHALLLTVDGPAVSLAEFGNSLSIAADEGSGHFFVYDGGGTNAVYEFTEEGQHVSTIKHEIQNVAGEEIAIDNGRYSPNGAQNPLGRYLYVPSHPGGTGHSFAFGPLPEECKPVVEDTSVTGVSEDDAELRATVEPCHLATGYRFEYTTQQSFDNEGFSGAQVAGEGEIPAAGAPVKVAAAAGNLIPGTAYVFRVVATNGQGVDEGGGSFSTYPSSLFGACPNDALRTGLSALLPDCRAYELVTPADTNGRAPIGIGSLGVRFTTRLASPSGDKVSFAIEGGTIPGSGGTGSLGGDPYLSTRGADGWSTAHAGPTGAETNALLPGSTSPDQGYLFWGTSGDGSAVVEGKSTNYVRYPDGHSELVGRGSLGADPRADGKLISENGSHIIFVSGGSPGTVAVRLEPDAPPTGTRTIYDRTSAEVTHVVSLLPGNKTPLEGEDASFVGASLDGRGVAFTIGGTLYLRHDDAATFEIGDDVVFAGIAAGGARAFYLQAGNLKAFDATDGKTISFSTSGNVIPVNVSADGTAAYFVSPSVLTKVANPRGAKAVAGKENLYLSREGSISFVGTVTQRDVAGATGLNVPVEGLGLWTEAVGPGNTEIPARLAIDPSRTTPDGSVLVFESRAALTDYESEEHAEVYRYDAAGSLRCLSCNPTGAAPTGRASLQSIAQASGVPEPFGPFVRVDNLRADGRRAFFQSAEALANGDNDNLQDVYEWEAQGVGSCTRTGGCVYLISSGHSARADYLYAVSDSGDDVFFRTADLLLPSDPDETPSIYDARVGGGFVETTSDAICEGEGCRPALIDGPQLPAPAKPALGAHDNVGRKKCPKGSRRAKRRGKVQCVKKHRHHRHNSAKKGAGK
jgi:hypothetical protein